MKIPSARQTEGKRYSFIILGRLQSITPHGHLLSSAGLFRPCVTITEQEKDVNRQMPEIRSFGSFSGSVHRQRAVFFL